MKQQKLLLLASFVILFVTACAPKQPSFIPMPSKVKDYSGYASGDGYAAQFKIKNNGNVMIYNDALTGTVMLVRDKNLPIFRGKFRDGVNVSSSSTGNAIAYGNVAYGNSNTYSSSSAKIRNMRVVYVYGDDNMKVFTPKHGFGSAAMTVSADTKQDFSSWHKKVEKHLQSINYKQ